MHLLIIIFIIYKCIYLLHPDLKHACETGVVECFLCARMFITYTIDRRHKNEKWCGSSVKSAQTTTNDVGFYRDGCDVASCAAAWCAMVYESNPPHPTDFTCKQGGRGGGKGEPSAILTESFLRFRDPQPLCVGAFSHEILRSNYMSSLCSWNLRLYC